MITFRNTKISQRGISLSSPTSKLPPRRPREHCEQELFERGRSIGEKFSGALLTLLLFENI